MPGPDRSNALDHVVVVMFENRSFDNLLGRLYQPGEVASCEGVTGRELINPWVIAALRAHARPDIR
jgi:phospholipase C